MSTLRRARKQHLSHLKSELSNLSPLSKSWWHLVQSVSGVCSPYIPSLTSNGRTDDNAHEKAECLNSLFASNSSVPNPLLSIPTLPSHTQLFLDSVSFPPNKVESLLSNLNSDSATGPDGISPRVLKTCSAALAHPLSFLFTLSFAQGHLPSAWKSANITALDKKVQKQIPATTDQSAFSQSSARLWNPSSLQTLNPSTSPMA